MDPFSSLSELPDFAEACVEECGRVRRAFVRESVGRIAGSDLPCTAIPWLGPVGLRWRFYLARRDGRLVLFFRRRKDEVHVALDSSISFRVEPAPSDTLPPESSPSEPSPAPATAPHPERPASCRISWPLFLASTEPGLAVFRMTTDSGIGRLELPVVGNAIDFASSRLFVGDEPRPFRVGVRNLLEPFVAWIETVGAWIRSPEAHASWRLLAPPTSDESLPARQILRAVVMTFESATRTAESAPPTAPSAEDDRLDIAHRQDIAAFEGKTWLRLKSDGTAIAESEDDDPLTLEMAYALDQDRETPRLSVRLRPPDFLVDGTLHRQILDVVANAAIDAGWHERGRPLGGDTGIGEDEARAFFASADATVLRIRRRRDRDRDLLWLRGSVRKMPLRLLLTASIRVQEPTDPIRPETRVLTLAPPPTPTSTHGATALMNATDKRDDGLVCYFAGQHLGETDFVDTQIRDALGRLMLALHRWGGIWPSG
ncbi:MAG: hypothetical protein JNL97_00430 [Verrucomicrobiales bacterium]|nr:hypothetical protein [Verrucomicrobiales bacterium]